MFHWHYYDGKPSQVLEVTIISLFVLIIRYLWCHQLIGHLAVSPFIDQYQQVLYLYDLDHCYCLIPIKDIIMHHGHGHARSVGYHGNLVPFFP